jgi:hypothetical protein
VSWTRIVTKSHRALSPGDSWRRQPSPVFTLWKHVAPKSWGLAAACLQVAVPDRWRIALAWRSNRRQVVIASTKGCFATRQKVDESWLPVVAEIAHTLRQTSL